MIKYFKTIREEHRWDKENLFNFRMIDKTVKKGQHSKRKRKYNRKVQYNFNRGAETWTLAILRASEGLN